MAQIVSQLTNGINVTSIFSVVKDVIPFVIVIIPIALGLYVLSRVLKIGKMCRTGRLY